MSRAIKCSCGAEWHGHIKPSMQIHIDWHGCRPPEHVIREFECKCHVTRDNGKVVTVTAEKARLSRIPEWDSHVELN